MNREDLEYAIGAMSDPVARDRFRRDFLASSPEVQKDIMAFFNMKATQDLIHRKHMENLGIDDD